MVLFGSHGFNWALTAHAFAHARCEATNARDVIIICWEFWLHATWMQNVHLYVEKCGQPISAFKITFLKMSFSRETKTTYFLHKQQITIEANIPKIFLSSKQDISLFFIKAQITFSLSSKKKKVPCTPTRHANSWRIDGTNYHTFLLHSEELLHSIRQQINHLVWTTLDDCRFGLFAGNVTTSKCPDSWDL